MRPDVLTRIDGLELAYRAKGSGPTLLLLHAFPLNQRMWDPLVEAISDHVHVVTVDLPGFGASQATDGTATIEDMADLVADFATKLGHEKFVLGGLSMGGYVALALARRRPERLRGLILADTKATADTEAARAKRMDQIKVLETKGTGALAEGFPHDVTTAATAIDRPELLTRMAGWIREANPLGLAGALRMMAGRPDATPTLAGIAVPTLVIVGADDALTPPADARAMVDALPAATLVEIPSAGHISALEAPAAFNAAVASYMAQFRD